MFLAEQNVPEESSRFCGTDAIAQAKHFLFIENQYFIAGCDISDAHGTRFMHAPQNRVARAVVARIQVMLCAWLVLSVSCVSATNLLHAHSLGVPDFCIFGSKRPSSD